MRERAEPLCSTLRAVLGAWARAGRALSGLVLVTGLLAGCGAPAGVVFPPPAQPVRWPAPPEVERIRLVGQLATSADLKPAIPFGQALNDLLFGVTPIQSMLTPFALCTDGADRLFIADSNAQVVHVFDMTTRRYEKWRPPGEGAGFSQPVGIAYDPAGRLWVADSVAGVVFVFDRRGKCLGDIGRGVLARPCGLAYDPASSRLFIADAGAHQVVILGADGSLKARIGQRGVAPGEFNYPTNVTLNRQGQLFVSDSLNFRVQVFDANFMPVRQIGRQGDLPGYFAQPKGLAVDSEGHLYVIDAQFETVQIFDNQGRLLMNFGEEGIGPGQFWLPTGIYIDARNRIWVADSYNRRVQVFDYVPEKQP